MGTYAHGSADVVEDDGPGVVDEAGLVLCAVVGPEDDVAVAVLAELLASGDDHGLAIRIADGQGTRRIEAQALDVLSGHT